MQIIHICSKNISEQIKQNLHENILDVSVSYVAQLDIAGSGIQVLDNDALASSAGVEALGLVSNRLSSIGDKSLL